VQPCFSWLRRAVLGTGHLPTTGCALRQSLLQRLAQRRFLADHVASPHNRKNALAASGEIHESAYHVLATDLPGGMANLDQQRHALGIRQRSPVRCRWEALSPVGIKIVDGRERAAEAGDVGAFAQQMLRERVAVAVVRLSLAGEDSKRQVGPYEPWFKLP
jgi:hypothetical protein